MYYNPIWWPYFQVHAHCKLIHNTTIDSHLQCSAIWPIKAISIGLIFKSKVRLNQIENRIPMQPKDDNPEPTGMLLLNTQLTH
jgi:hypothetical protein